MRKFIAKHQLYLFTCKGVKVLVPQSSIPGMFIVLLPWMYCPLVWMVYNVAFQMVGNMWLFIGLIIQAFGPMVYFVIGSFMQVTKPMDDRAITKVINRMAIASGIFTLGSITFLCMFALDGEAHHGLVHEVLDRFASPRYASSSSLSSSSSSF